MTERYTREELASKVEWEGGVYEAIKGYGIGLDALPVSTPSEIRAAWQTVARAVEKIQTWLDCDEEDE
jgi:hypothetical protein